MDTSDPIDAYLRELERELRVRGKARRRILVELRAHLLDVVDAEQSRGAEADVAAQRAVVRCGLVAETARQFNCLAARRGAILRRTLVPWVAAVALSLMATATVWAFQAGAPRSRHVLDHPAVRQRCVPSAIAVPPVRATREVPLASFPSAPHTRTRAACGVRRANAR
jgi:hypothetical protein